MERFSTLKQKALKAFFAVAMVLMGQSAMAQSEDFFLTVIGGSKADGSKEGCEKLVDGLAGTKWGQTWSADANLYVIMKGSEAIVPKDYYVITGADTGDYPERNWRTWYIYAANFDSDAEATQDAAGWVLIDKKESVGDIMIPGESGALAQLTISENVTTAYKYFKIEVKEIQTFETVYMQMAEFGFGTPAESIAFTPLLTGDRNGAMNENESANKLVDGFDGSKWGFGDGDNIPHNSWLVFKSSQPFAPTYYTMFTANDTGTYGSSRNWKEWYIYGANFESDAEATNENPNWVLIDHKVNENDDVVPAVNATEFFLSLSEDVAQAYSYFKVHITKGGGGFVQMAELTLGTDYSFRLKRDIYYRNYAALDLNVKAYKPYVQTYSEALESLKGVTVPTDMNAALTTLKEAKAQIDKSTASYSTYESTVTNANASIKTLSDEGKAFFNTYMTTNAGPSAAYPNGTYLYIMENCPLDVDGITAECSFIGAKLEEYAAVDLTEGAIVDVTFVPLAGTEGFGGEGYDCLMDGDTSTKWCTGDGFDNTMKFYGIYHASEPIAPTYYRLVTGNDTGSYPDRNWKSWRVYGGNFESEEAATRDADGWVLIDDKVNIGKDQIPAANTASCYLYMSQPSETPFEYFRVEVYEIVGAGTMQMAEMTFQNTANFYLSRKEYVEEFSELDFSEMYVQKSIIDEYNTTLEKMKNTTSLAELGTLYTAMSNLRQSAISCDGAYVEYKTAIEGIMNEWLGDIIAFAPEMSDYFDDANEVEPNTLFPNGNFGYILNNCKLSASEVAAERAYWQAYIESMTSGKAIVLEGNTRWSDGENWEKLLDGDEATKWGGNMPTDGAYVIFRFLTPQQPFFYSLMTGGDTETYNTRNWKTWKIYGGNFENNSEATRDAEGWVLIDSHEGIDRDRLPAANNYTSYFGFTEGMSEPYQYYRIEVSEAYSGRDIQMTELKFLTEDDFMTIRDEYANEVLMFDNYVVADQELLDQYEGVYETIMASEDMETLVKNYTDAIKLQNDINASAKVYEEYNNAMQNIIAFLQENELDESEALSKANSYLNDNLEEEEDYPNGTYPYIYETHMLNDSTVLAEIDFAESLLAAAVKAGYTPGTEITSMVVNPKFKKAQYTNNTTIAVFDGWEGTGYTFGTNEEGTMSAAENVHQRCDINQTITGLKNGIYEVRMNAGYRPCGDIYSKNYAAQLYANDNAVYVQGVIEDMVPVEEAIDRVNCWLGTTPDKPVVDEVTGDTIGYVIWGVQGSCYAFAAGRYENTIVANVTDGTLTIGIKDPGTSVTDNEWLGFGNTRLIYHGELGSEQSMEGIDNALACDVARAQALIEWECSLSGDDYKQKPNFSQADRDALQSAINDVNTASTAAAKYALVEKFTEIFNRIYETKKAYITLFEGEQNVYEKWSAHAGLMTIDESDQFSDACTTIEDGIYNGDYDIEGALKAKADIYEKYPDYFEYNTKLAQSPNLTVTEVTPFAYDMVATGNMPFLTMDGLYEDLTEEKTVLAFEYIAESGVDNGFFYFDSNASHNVSYETLPASTEWKKAYFDITEARQTWNWGAKASTLRWAISNNQSQTLQARYVRVISKAQMDAEGGTFTGISTVSDDTAVKHTGIYTITGIRVEKPTRGLYIINGKKVLVK